MDPQESPIRFHDSAEGEKEVSPVLGDPAPDCEARLPLGYGGRFYGVYPALVTDLKDPENLGRVEVALPWSPDGKEKSYKVWARIATLMGGSGRGTWFIPDLDDEVLLSFEGGDPRKPYVLRGLWNGKDAPPEQMDEEGKNDLKSFTSRTGVKITLDDTDAKQRLLLETPAEQRLTFQDDPESEAGFIQLDDSNGNQTLFSKDGILIKTTAEQRPITIQDVNGNTIKLTSDSISIIDKFQNKIELTSSGITITDKSSDSMTLSGGTITVKNQAGNKVTLSSGDVVIEASPSKATVARSEVKLESPPGKLSLGPAAIEASHPAGVNLTAAASSLKLSPAEAAITAPTAKVMGMGGVTIMSGAAMIKVDPSGVTIMGVPRLSVTAPIVSFAAPMVSFAGVLQCTTLIAPTVVGTAYTPGAGNFI